MAARTRFAGSVPDTSRIWELVLFVGLMGWTVVLVLAQSSGRIEMGPAIVLLALPILAVGVVIRPAWVVLFLVAAPIAQIPVGPMRGLVLLLLMTLVAQLIVRGGVSIGWRSGFLGLIALLAGAFFFRLELSGDSALIARGMLNDFTFYVLLGLVAYNATRTGDLNGRHLVNAVLLGLVLGVLLEQTPFVAGGILGTGTRQIGRPVAYLAAAGFGIVFARLVVRPHDMGRYPVGTQLALAGGFLVAMIPGLVRGAWLTALVAILFISLSAGKKRYWFFIVIAFVVMLSVPVARERIVPSQEQGGGFTTGRLELWSRLWEEIVPSLPWGNGFGHMITLDSETLFGTGSTSFNPDASSEAFVYPHNDFLFWMGELGVLGLFAMILFWGQLIRTFSTVVRSGSRNSAHVQILTGVVVAAFITQLVGSTFFFRSLAIPFFGVAGFIFGSRKPVGIAYHSR